MAAYTAGEATVDIYPSMKGFHQKLKRDLAGINPQVSVSADLREMKRQVQSARLPAVKLQVEVDKAKLAKAEADVAAAEKRMAAARDIASDSASRAKVAEQQLEETRTRAGVKASQLTNAELRLAQAKRQSASASNDAANAEAALNAARGSLKDVQAKVQLDVDTASATARIKAWALAMSRSAKIEANMSVNAPSVATATRHFQNLRGSALGAATAVAAVGPAASGLVTLTSAALQAAKTVALIPAALSVAGATLAAGAVGGMGVAGAFKEMTQTASGAAGGSNSVASATKNLARAYQDANRSRDDAARNIAQAELSALRQVRSAEEALISTKRAHRAAQDDVTRAVREYNDQQEDLALQARGGAVAEKQAALDLKDAQKAYEDAKNAGTTGDDLERLLLAYERQQIALDETKLRNERLGEQQQKAAALGVDGADSVVAARQRESEAAEAVMQAQRARDEAEVDGRAQVADANRAYAAAMEQSQRQIEDALAAVSTAAAGGAGGVDAYAEALGKLSPNAREFVTAAKELLPAWQAVQQATQDALFAGTAEKLQQLSGVYLPVMKSGLTGIATEMNTVGLNFADMLMQGRNVESVNLVFGNTQSIIRNLGEATPALGQAFLDLSAVGSGVLVDLSAEAGAFAKTWAESITRMRDSGDLREMMLDGVQSVKDLGAAIYEFGQGAVTIVKSVAQGFSGTANDSRTAAQVIRDMAESFNIWAQQNIGYFTQLGETSRSVLTILTDLWNGVRAVVSPVLDLLNLIVQAAGDGMGPLIQLAGALYALDKITFGTLGAQFSGIGDSIRNTEGTAGKFGKALGGLAGAFNPVTLAIGAAAFGLTLWQQKSQDAAANAAAHAGRVGDLASALKDSNGAIDENVRKTAAKALQDFKVADGTRNLLADLRGIPGAQQLATDAYLGNTEAGKQLVAMLRQQQEAHTSVDTSTGSAVESLDAEGLKYKQTADIIEGAGGTFADAVQKNLDLSNASKDVASNTDKVRDSEKKLQEQRLGLVDADLAYRQSVNDLATAQKSYNDALNDPEGDPTRRTGAELQLEQAYLRVATAAGDRAVKEQGVAGTSEESRVRTEAYNAELVKLAGNMTGPLPASMQTYISKMTDSELSAINAKRATDAFGNSVITLPDGKTVTINAATATAEEELQRLIRDRTANIAVKFKTTVEGGYYLDSMNQKKSVGNTGYAEGGFVSGEGTATSDSILAWLSNGEFVIPADMTARYRPILELMRAGKYASGGPVGGASSTPTTAAASGGQAAVAVDPAAFTALAEGSELARAALEALANSISTVVNAAVESMRLAIIGLDTQTTVSLAAMTTSWWALATQHGLAWQQMTLNTEVAGQSQATAVSQSVTQQNQALAALQQGLAATRTAVSYTADWVASEFARMKEAAASPVRWVIQFPFNAGLIAAWNKLDADFALGKKVSDVPLAFAVGGKVPGNGNRDSVKAWLTPGEYVLSKPAIENMGGLAAVDRMHQAARAGDPTQQLGRTYQDGSEKLRLMKRVPLDGLGFAYGGVQPHVAAAGQEIEAKFGRLPGGIGGVGSRGNVSDHPSGHALDFMSMKDLGLGDRIADYLMANAQRMMVKYLIWKQRINSGGGWDGMEDRGSITANHFDHVHASFLRLGQAGKAFSGANNALDIGALADAAFAASYKYVDEVGTKFPGNTMAAQGAGVARQAVDKVKASAVQKISDLMVGGFGVDAGMLGSADVVAVVKAAAAKRGWHEGPQWDALAWIIGKESGWRPNAQNPTSTAYGLFQFLDSTWAGTGIAKTGNPALQAEAGMRYIGNRYKDPVGARAFWQSHRWYHGGGYVNGPRGADIPAVLTPGERVLDPNTTRVFDSFVAGLSRSSAYAEPQYASAPGIEMNVTTLPHQNAAEVAADTSRRLAFELRNH